MIRYARLASLWTARDGVSAIEFAIVAPIIGLLLLGVIDLATGLWEQMQVSNAAQAGAFYASTQGWNATISGVQSAVTNATSLSSMTPTLSSSAAAACQATAPSSMTSAAWCGCPSASGTSWVSCGTTSCSDGSTPGHYVTVCAQVAYTPILKLPGITLPTTLFAQSYARLYP